MDPQEVLWELYPFEREIALRMGTLRSQSNRSSGVTDAQIGSQNALRSDQEGAATELLYCRINNVYPDLTLGPRSGGVDCTGPNGVTVDVKSTTWLTGRLIITIEKAIKSTETDVYVLFTGSMDDGYYYRGYASYNQLVQPENIIFLKGVKDYALEQKYLLPGFPLI